ncbi:hypothetical protein HLB23_40465 [Nocardia uniformis]|uniref:Uncharacterized protein n=1 Tax=Nocardia uniformis TaxID=53432 RepID=A0A849CBP4_9NOCA|nr:hypothetical protein [Nocardia uniformis]NNH76054.1 hypothetical protein [Nocardia uniformis]
MSAFALFLVGVGVGSATLWLFQTWRTTTDEPSRPHQGRDPERWSVQRIAARIAEEERTAPRPRHHARVADPTAGARPVTGWPTIASVG